MTFARSAGSRGSWASPRAGANRAAATAAAVTRDVLFIGKSPLQSAVTSAVLRTGRHDLAVRERQHPKQAGPGAVARAAGFRRHRFADGVLEIHLVDVAGAEEARRRALDRPALHLVAAALG